MGVPGPREFPVPVPDDAFSGRGGGTALGVVAISAVVVVAVVAVAAAAGVGGVVTAVAGKSATAAIGLDDASVRRG